MIYGLGTDMDDTVENGSALSTEEVSVVLDTVDRFRKREIGPLVERPERVMTGEEMEQVCKRAIEAGLGLWEDASMPGRVALSLLAVEALARSNAGAAYHLHLLALGRHLATRLSIDTNQTIVPCLQGMRGLARDALAMFLEGKAPDENARKLLKEHFPGPVDRSLEFLMQAGEPWRGLLAPTWQDDPPALLWMLLPREDLETRSLGPAHGFDETPVWEIVFPDDPKPMRTAKVDQALAREVLIEGLGLNALALMAIGLGSVRRAYATAKEYAADRVQGGRPIDSHAAVQLMLGNISAVIGSLEGMLRRFDTPPRSLKQLVPVFQARVVAHPLLCAAANQAMQVLGGTGYMQDAGIEKIVRDTNHLKVSFGTPDDLRLFLAAAEAP
jgi:butyryl-CoA dehydrogenase